MQIWDRWSEGWDEKRAKKERDLTGVVGAIISNRTNEATEAAVMKLRYRPAIASFAISEAKKVKE